MVGTEERTEILFRKIRPECGNLPVNGERVLKAGILLLQLPIGRFLFLGVSSVLFERAGNFVAFAPQERWHFGRWESVFFYRVSLTPTCGQAGEFVF